MIVKIQHRRGAYAYYDPTKVLPGEIVVVQSDAPNSDDGKAIYIGTTAGDVKRLATEDELESVIANMEQYVEDASDHATLSRSYAKGGTNSRTGENTDNSKYYKEQAASFASSASTSASTATTKASEASASATAAATSATNASSSATAASTSAGQAASSAAAAIDSAEDAQEMSYAAEAWAVGTKNGIDVGSGDPQYHNNAKYYAEQAEAAQVLIAEVYDATTTYAIGDYCLHDGQLYECTAEITTPEAWTAAHWTAATVGTELNDIQDDVSELKEDLSQLAIKSENLLNPADYDIGHYYRASDGAYRTLAGYACILVPVTEGETYSFTNVATGQYVFFHDTATKSNYVSGATLSGINQLTAPPNGTLLALGINTTTTPINKFMFVKGNTVPSGYVDYGEVFVNGDQALLDGEMLQDVVTRLMESRTFYNTEPLPNNDADTIFNNSIYGFWGSTNITHLPNNANQGILITIAGDTVTYQLFVSFEATKITTYLRRYYNNSWNSWSEYFGNPLFETYYGTYTTLPWNTADDVPLNSVISFQGVPYSNFANLPHPFSILNNGSNSGILITTKGSARIYLQTFIAFDGGMYSRTYTINTSTWSDWKGIANSPSNYTIDASGNGNTTSFAAGIRYAYTNNIRDVYVNPGTYDLISEFQALYGDNWIDAVASDPVIAEGLPIGHGMVLHCSKKAYIKMIYEGSDTRITTTFSPLNAEIGDYTIDGLNIECQNVRYCVHDELSGHPQYAKHVYINCEMKKTTTDASTWNGYQCIGGGMGHCSVIDVSDSIFESIAPEGSTDDMGAISWHNNANADAKSYISVKNCVFLGNQGYPRFSYYGLSTVITQVLCSNCKMTRTVSTRGESGATIVNVNVNAWNNEVAQ